MHDPRWCLPNKRLAIQQYKTHFINLKHVWQSNTIAVLQAHAQSPSRLFLWSGIACVTLLQVHTFANLHKIDQQTLLPSFGEPSIFGQSWVNGPQKILFFAF